MTIGELKEIIKDYPDEMEIRVYNSADYDTFTKKFDTLDGNYIVVSKSTDSADEAVYLQYD